MDHPYRDGPHVEAKENGLTRIVRMKFCNCRLCYLCLNPPKTWALYESFGLDRIGPESKPMTHALRSDAERRASRKAALDASLKSKYPRRLK